jgi:nucleoside-diphosphate kinase
LNNCEKCNRGCGLNLTEKDTEEAEKSLIIIKPDAVQKKVAGKIISRFEDAGFEIEQLKMMHIDEAFAARHYKDHTEKAFFKPLLKYICSGPVIAMVVKGEGAIKKARELMGPTDSKKAPSGTIRGDFGVDTTINVVHGSDCTESADREIKLFFG